MASADVLASTASAEAAPYCPGPDGWARTAPHAAGFDAAALEAAVAEALADRSLGIVVLRGGRIVAEAYAPGWGPEESRQIASGAKSVVSTLVGIAIDQGCLNGVEQRAADFIPQWRDGPKAAITLRHLMSMTAGVAFEGLAPRGIAGDQLAINAAAPLAHPPGTHWAYDTPSFHLLYHILERATGEPLEAYARRVLLDPLGMEHWAWLTSIGQGASGPVTNFYTASCSTLDFARFGLFALRGGAWDGRQLVSRAYLEAALSPSQELNPAYGYLWWLNRRPGFGLTGEPGYRFAGSPPDTFAAMGAGGQVAIQTPSLDLVVVRQGEPPQDAAAINRLQAGVVAALGWTAAEAPRP